MGGASLQYRGAARSRQETSRARAVGALGGLRGHPLRHRRGHRQDHHQPPGGPQRLPADHPVRAVRRLRAGPQRPGGRGDHPHRRRGPGLLLRRRPAHPGRRRLRGPAGHPPAERARPADPDAPPAQADHRHGGRLRHRRRPRAAPGLRPHHRRRQRRVRPDRPEGGLLRRGLRGRPPGPHGGRQAGPGDLVPLPPVLGAGGLRDGDGQQGRPPGRTGDRDGGLGPGDPGQVPAGRSA